jgi:hypothetical protein
MALNCSQFCVSDRMFLMAILKVAALQKEGQLNYINALTIKYFTSNVKAIYPQEIWYVSLYFLELSM